ncbi:hypothetical protein GE09DRAFT_1284615 [Coniochaeta sp. 2T2.1]|nr:hypothetical protein GE09DRAFT_1284615 [Coniochaeta sp. 2T2.1]
MSDSELEMSQQDALSGDISRELGMFVASKSSTFACGGSIPIKETVPESPSKRRRKDDILSTTSITIRWDSPQGNEAISLGIIDTIAQVLLPNTKKGILTNGVRAELYKLNIYSSPSGFFKSHVDTPRSEAQFGSLVISLPCHHEGGQLVVRHAGHIITYDWSTSKAWTDAVHWAAFYSDCEHEVKKLTAGHRVTLTYNLYYAPGVGDLAEHAPAMYVTTLPLYHKVHSALSEPEFMRDGGILGIYCTHAYAHSTQSGGKALPAVLKGTDMAVYAVFRAHGLKVLDVNWLTDPGPQELEDASLVHLTYGNQAGVNTVYTHAALLVKVPPANKRRQVNKPLVDLTEEDSLPAEVSQASSTQLGPASIPTGSRAERRGIWQGTSTSAI